jgi:hypothetical protein
MGQEELILGHHEMNYGTKQGFSGILKCSISNFMKVIMWKISR